LPWAGAASNRPEMIIGVNQNTFYSAALRAHEGAKARLARATSISAPENQHREQSPGADHRQLAGIYYHSLVCMRGPAARRAYTGAILTKKHMADAAASAAPKINNR
jgi:hypothetical protein